MNISKNSQVMSICEFPPTNYEHLYFFSQIMKIFTFSKIMNICGTFLSMCVFWQKSRIMNNTAANKTTTSA